MLKHLRWLAAAILAVACVFLAGSKIRAQLVAAATVKDDSKVAFFSAKQLDSEIHKASEAAPGTFLFALTEYDPRTGGTTLIRRTGPGRAEVHKRLADLWYVISGEATLVTGGSLAEPSDTPSDEPRGRAITGGSETHIAPGDFVRIPAGVPHWIRQIHGKELCYLVVKVAPG
jgi:mannose-6-phosphate isomerase-like protein (cupin superfamily)